MKQNFIPKSKSLRQSHYERKKRNIKMTCRYWLPRPRWKATSPWRSLDGSRGPLNSCCRALSEPRWRFFLLSGHSLNVIDFCRETFTFEFFELKGLLFWNHSLFNVENILFFWSIHKISKVEANCFENHIEWMSDNLSLLSIYSNYICVHTKMKGNSNLTYKAKI